MVDDVAVPSITAVAAAAGDTVLGVKGGVVRRLAGLALSQDVSNIGTSPRILGKTDPTTIGIDSNVIIGGSGTWDDSASSKTRPAWDAIGGVAPGASANDLELTGHAIHASPNSAVIIGGRAAYYSYVGPKASLSTTLGGDNYNGHLAGIALAYHVDLIDDDLGNGSHGAAVGGSFKVISGDYAGTFAGTRHFVHGLQSVTIGGQSLQIGTKADSTLVRRAAILCGLNNLMSSGYEGVILGGYNNTYTSGNRSAIISGEGNKVSANYAVVFGIGNDARSDASIAAGRDSIADIPNAFALSGGKFTSAGDNQTYLINARREVVGTTNFLSVSGGSGVDIYTPPSNTIGVLSLSIVAARTDVLGETAAYNLLVSFTNIGGTLLIKGQTLTVVHEDAVGYNAAAEIVGSGTRIGVRCTNAVSSTVRWSASGILTIQKAP